MAVRQTKKKKEEIENTAVETPQIVEVGADKSIENTLVGLYKLQTICSKIDKVRINRGELPLEVRDLEDTCMGLQSRIDKYQEAIKEWQQETLAKKEGIKKSQSQIAKYEEQQNNVRNNREYDALSKEIEYENLEIQVCDKKIKEFGAKIADKQEEISKLTAELTSHQADLKVKKDELDEIIAETQKEEESLLAEKEQQEQLLEPRMLAAFNRIRTGCKNGLATVRVERNACGGCFSQIPSQRQIDIKMHKKIIICEFCGRILIDDTIAEMSQQ